MYQVVVGFPELAEVHCLNGLQSRLNKCTFSLGTSDINGKPKVNMSRVDFEFLAVFFTINRVHLWVLYQRADHGVTDQVGKGDTATTGTLQVVIDRGAVIDERLDWHVANGGRGRHR